MKGSSSEWRWASSFLINLTFYTNSQLIVISSSAVEELKLSFRLYVKTDLKLENSSEYQS